MGDGGDGGGVDQGHGTWQTHHEEDPPSPPVAFSHLVAPHSSQKRAGDSIRRANIDVCVPG